MCVTFVTCEVRVCGLRCCSGSSFYIYRVYFGAPSATKVRTAHCCPLILSVSPWFLVDDVEGSDASGPLRYAQGPWAAVAQRQTRARFHAPDLRIRTPSFAEGQPAARFIVQPLPAPLPTQRVPMGLGTSH